ncbi:hypothetical protein PPACK8108_LOCUS23066 [Phakopsora pachyrhizi]|uniref:Uncharacterized protein n=1 Tax=Phakopsora pachyrhizi TaxID=170000 RepID=A0AAV0BLF4_PHAPC|nr:hypothetical protein PPACK8108_LOCUS23066 [Phakopsora pachyrhizi]
MSDNAGGGPILHGRDDMGESGAGREGKVTASALWKEQLKQVTTNTKIPKRTGAGWDGQQQSRNWLERVAVLREQGNKRWRRVDNHRADKARKRAPKKNVDWLTDKEAMGRKRQGGRPRVDSGDVSVGLVRRWRRTDIRYIGKAVVERRLGVGPVGLWHWAVEVGRRARRRHTVVWTSYHFRVGAKVNSTANGMEDDRGEVAGDGAQWPQLIFGISSDAQDCTSSSQGYFNTRKLGLTSSWGGTWAQGNRQHPADFSGPWYQQSHLHCPPQASLQSALKGERLNPQTGAWENSNSSPSHLQTMQGALDWIRAEFTGRQREAGVDWTGGSWQWWKEEAAGGCGRRFGKGGVDKAVTEEKLGEVAHQDQNDWSKITGATNL